MNLDHESLEDTTNDQPNSYTCAERHEVEQILLANLKAHHVELLNLLALMSDHTYEDTVYRFYSGSFKLYQQAPQRTAEIVAALQRLAPHGTKLCLLFEEIYQTDGEAEMFSQEHNQSPNSQGRNCLEAFFHARYFLEMAVKYGMTLDEAPDYLPSGWAALLCLYGIR